MKKLPHTIAWSLLVALGCSASTESEQTRPTDVFETGTLGTEPDGAGTPGSDGPAMPGTGATGWDPAAAGAGAEGGSVLDADPSQHPMGVAVGDPVEGLPIAPECQGIQFRDIRYSPGGTALPNVCEPFHATSNNPYAVRCVDAWPWYETPYPGDQYCILPPPPERGIQFGFHPQGDGDAWFHQVVAGDLSGYEGLAGTPWELGPGLETDVNYIGGTDNPDAHDYYRAYIRMRSGSHHSINSIGGTTRGTWTAGSATGLTAGQAAVPGAQRTDENRPNSLEKPAEDAGLYKVWPARPNITFNIHHFNSTPGPILKEEWVNIWWEDDATIPIQNMYAVPVSQFLLLNVPQNSTVDLHYAYSFAQPTRILELFGHRHSWTPRFTAWVERSGGATEIVYQSTDWFDMPTYRYDSLTENPVPVPGGDGGHSGVLTVQPGEKLHFNCHITFTDERAAQTGGPSPQTVGTLGFANEAYDAEMCILFGHADAPVGVPVDDLTPLPSFIGD